MREPKALTPARIKWAVELLDMSTTSNVLEIGCGSGIAAQRICALLGRGSYTGVDRSPAAINAAIARNNAYANVGRAVFIQADFNAADREPALFDRILAVNVNAFWTSDGAEVLDVRRVLPSRGRFVQVYEPPSSAQRSKIAEIVTARMAPHFGNVTTELATRDGKGLLAILATGAKAR